MRLAHTFIITNAMSGWVEYSSAKWPPELLPVLQKVRVIFARTIRKLSYSKVWVPSAQQPPEHQTVIIFDWDDTLLCASFLNLRQEQHLGPAVVRHLRRRPRSILRQQEH